MKLTDGKYRVLILLERQTNSIGFQERGEVPFKICQKGIAEAVKLTRPAVIYIVDNFIDKGIIKEETRRVLGLKRRRKVYTLTQKGLQKAKNIREKIEEKEVKIKNESNEYKTKLKNIDSYIDSQNPLLMALNNITENDVIDLTHPEEEPEDVFVGRKDELQLLQNRLEKVRDDGSSTILIKGKAGIGKTRLVNEFKDRALSEGFDFLMGKGHYDSLEPYLPFKEAFKKFQNLNEINPIAFSYMNERNEDLRNENDEKTKRDLIFSETTENIRSLAEKNHMVIFIDDLQWSDKASLMLFHYLTEKLVDVPVLIIGAYRSEDVDRTDFLIEVLQRMNRKNLYEELELEPLCWEDTKEIVQGIIGRIDVPDDFVNIIHNTSEGSPLFSKEFVKQMLEDGSVDPKNDKYPSKKEDIELPEVVDDIIERRIKKLDQKSLRILKMGSVIGEEVPFELLDFVTDIDSLNLLEYVDILTGTGLWANEPDEDVFYFTHGLIQLSVYERIPETLRKELHKRVAESIEELFENEIEDYYFDLGFHCKRAELFSKAFKCFYKAGDEAKRVYAHEDALERYDEALELFERGSDLIEGKKWKILEKRGDVNKIIGKYDDSINDYEKIPLNKVEPEYKQRIYRKMASIYERKGSFDKALEAVKRGLAERDDENIETCRLLSRRGFSKMRQGKCDLAEEDFLYALDICENFDTGREYANIHQGLGAVYLNKGKVSKAISHLEKSLEEWKKIGDIEGKSSSLNGLGSVYSKKGDFDKALEHYKQSLELRKKIGDKRKISACLNNIGTMFSKKGNLKKSFEYYMKSKEMWEEIDDQQGIAVSLINLGEHYITKGNLDYALEKMKKSLDISKNIQYIEGVAVSLNNLGDIFFLKRELDEATKNYQMGLKVSRKKGYQQVMHHLLSGLVEIHLQEDNLQKALKKSKKTLEISKNIKAKVEEGISHRLLGMSYRKKKEWGEAEEEFDKGREILIDVGEKKELAELLYQHALLWKDMDEKEKKKEYLEKALAMFEDMGMKLWIEKCEEELA